MIEISIDRTDDYYQSTDIDLALTEPTHVDGHDWLAAVDDLHKELTNVPASEFQYLLNRLNAGLIDGTTSMMGYNVQNCGCFIGTLGHHIIEDGDMGEWTAFQRAYGEVITHLDSSPFQQWLYFVQPGDTPATNKIAALFATELRSMIAKREAEHHEVHKSILSDLNLI